MKLLKSLAKVTFGLILAVLVMDALLVFGIGNSKPNIPENTDAIIILGAAINTPALYNRSIEGLRLYEQGKGKVLVLSGGRISDKDISEAQYMEKVIKKNAKTTPPMVLEEESHSTFENIRNSRSKIGEAKSVIIVSDTFHVARGFLMAKAAGFADVYWSSPEPSYYKKGELGFYYFRELAAMLAYIPKFLFEL
jgi:uncharacterized SAM-binding protein YcdF (DUF218 family)